MRGRANRLDSASHFFGPCVCLQIIGLLDRRHPVVDRRALAAELRRQRALVARILFAPQAVTDEAALGQLRGRGGRRRFISRVVKDSFEKRERRDVLRSERNVAAAWIAELDKAGIGTWPALRKHWRSDFPSAAPELMCAVHPDGLARISAALNETVRSGPNGRPIAVLAALRGRSVAALKDLLSHRRGRVRVRWVRVDLDALLAARRERRRATPGSVMPAAQWPFDGLLIGDDFPPADARKLRLRQAKLSEEVEHLRDRATRISGVEQFRDRANGLPQHILAEISELEQLLNRVNRMSAEISELEQLLERAGST